MQAVQTGAESGQVLQLATEHASQVEELVALNPAGQELTQVVNPLTVCR
jgi:hypothetical protein